MNIPELYLTEPYNAYAPKGKKKHWHEIVEEQALMAKIIAEANRNSTLAPDMPNQATPEIQAIPPAGGGGMPRPQFFTPSMTIGYTQSTLTASAPVLVQFTNTGDDLLYALDTIYLNWNFGDGTTGIGPNPIHLYQTTGSDFAVTMSAVAKVDPNDVATANSLIKITAPTVTSAWTLTGTSVILTAGYYTASTGDTLSFVNGTVTNNPANTITYTWNFDDGNSSTSKNTTHVYSSEDTYNVLLSATGSFNIMSAGLRKVLILEPSLTADIDPVWADAALSGSAPFEVVFTDASTYNIYGTPTSYLWDFGSGSITSTAQNPDTMSYADPGEYTVTLTVNGPNGLTSTATRLVLVS